jgi:hypothetical protein
VQLRQIISGMATSVAMSFRAQRLRAFSHPLGSISIFDIAFSAHFSRNPRPSQRLPQDRMWRIRAPRRTSANLPAQRQSIAQDMGSSSSLEHPPHAYRTATDRA